MLSGDNNLDSWFAMKVKNNLGFITLLATKGHDGTANYVPQGKSSLQPVCVNKVLLQCSHTHVFTYCLCYFPDTGAELNSRNRDCVTQKD